MKNYAITKLLAGVAFTFAAFEVQAASVVSWNLVDFNSDGLMSDFSFFSTPTGNTGNKFGAAVTSAPTPLTGPCADGLCDPIAMNTGEIGDNIFTSGITLGGAVPFTLNIKKNGGGGNIAADITADILTFSALDLGVNLAGVQIFLAPDTSLANVTVETFTDLGGGNYGVVVRYVSTINDPSHSFNGFEANFRLEGVMTTVPEASSYGMMLAGLGLVGMVATRRRNRT